MVFEIVSNLGHAPVIQEFNQRGHRWVSQRRKVLSRFGPVFQKRGWRCFVSEGEIHRRSLRQREGDAHEGLSHRLGRVCHGVYSHPAR